MPSSKTQQNSQEEASDEDSGESSSPAPAADRNQCSEVEDHTPVPSERSPSLTQNAKHLRINSAGGGGSRGQTSQVYLEETGEDTDPLIHTNVKHSKNSQSQRREPNITLSELTPSQVTFDLLDQEEPDQMGRRRSGRKRRGSQGDGGGAKSKSPTTSEPSSPAITSLARSPETWAESPFEEAPKTVRECSRGEAPNSPEAGSYEDTVQTEWAEAHLSEDNVESLDPVCYTLTSVTDSDMDEETVVRLTETPESKRRSVKVSHSEVKFFTKKVFVTSKTPTEDQHEKLKRAGDTMDLGLTKTEDSAR